MEEVAVIDAIYEETGLDRDGYLPVIKAKRSFHREAMKQYLMAMKVGGIYGIVSTGDGWGVIRYDVKVFLYDMEDGCVI